MGIKVNIPSYLRPFADGRSQVVLSTPAATVAEVLGDLWRAHPGLRDRVLTEQGAVRQHVNIFAGDENIRDCGGFAAPVADGCEITIVPNVSGG
jgi:molybdopterin synthase sulfur carrier subunit